MCSSGDGFEKHARLMFSLVPSRTRWLIYLCLFSAFGYLYFFIADYPYFAEANVRSFMISFLLASVGAAFVLNAISIMVYTDRKGWKLVSLSSLF
jgi:hypothetical protein